MNTSKQGSAIVIACTLLNMAMTAVNVSMLQPQITIETPAEITTEEVIVEQPIEKKPTITCHTVCNGADDLVQYAYDISDGNMDFILTITQESKWDWKSETHRGEY